MSQTVVGLFDTPSDAQKVKEQLTSEGYAAADIRVLSNESDGFAEGASSEARTSSTGETGIVASVKNFFRSLTGSDEAEQEYYTRGVSAGGALLAVTAADEQVESVISLLEAHGARDVNEQETGEGRQARSAAATSQQTSGGTAAYRQTGTAAASSQQTSGGTAAYRQTGTAEATSQQTSGGTAIPIVEEELQLGKRQVQRGGVRVYSRVIETPVEEDIQLREEHVRVERTPVNRPASAADFDAFKEGSIELTETAEEAVVGKQARVVEEVRVGKDVTERTETVTDKLRRTEVEVEQIPGDVNRKTKSAGEL